MTLFPHPQADDLDFSDFGPRPSFGFPPSDFPLQRFLQPLARLLLVLALCGVLPLSVSQARADGDVADCTQAELEAAIQSGGLVTFDSDCTMTLTNTITITNDVTIDGSGLNVTISGGNLLRIFDVEAGATLTLNSITLTGGLSTNGGAMFIKGNAQVVMTDCVVGGNAAQGTNGFAGIDGHTNSSGIGGNGTSGGAGVAGYGGAIYNLGDLTASTTQFLTNRAIGGNGGNGGNGAGGASQGGNGGNGGNGGGALGGAIYNAGTVSLDSCTLDSNTTLGGNGGGGGTPGSGPYSGLAGNGGAGAVGSGAGLYNTREAIVQKCTFSDNTGTGGNSAAGGTSSSGFGSNGPRGGDSLGGGLFNSAFTAVTNCTFASNSVTGGNGGNGGSGPSGGGNGGNGGNGLGAGVYNLTGTNFVVNCTIAFNQAIGGTNGLAGAGFGSSNGSPGVGRGAGVARSAGTFILKNSILSTNAPGTNSYGTVTDSGNNLSSDSSLSGTSLKKTDPRLGPLADNGGPTETMALLTKSPAIDAADDAAAPDTDQRGITRPQGAHSDIGAYETTTVPVIETQPKSQTQTNGGSVTFTVSAFGQGLTYQWRFYGTSSTPTNISGATSSTFTIASVSPANAGDYDVVVSNSFGTVTSSRATLTVALGPTLTAAPTNQTVLAGSPVTFAASAAGDPPLAFQWQLNGTNIVGATNSTLTFTNPQPANAGNYTVTVTNQFGSVTSAVATLVVNAAPSIQTQPASQSVSVGSGVTFTVVANGTAPLGYQWRFFGTNIPLANGPSYNKSSVQTNDAGPYDVIVTNSFGSAQSAQAILAVTPPVIAGRILAGTNGLGGVNVTITGTNGAFVLITDTNGLYLTNVAFGTYTVTPALTNYVFSPGSISLTIPPSSNTVNFAAFPSFMISGRVLDGTNSVSGVTVTAGTNSAVTDVTGVYSITGVRAGDYFVFASRSGYQFSSAQEVVLGPSATNVNFTVTSRLYNISGRVTLGGVGLSGVRIAGINTDANGNYSLTVSSGTNVLTPTKPGYSFGPASRTVVTPPDEPNQDFIAGWLITSIVHNPNGSVKLTVAGTGRIRVEASSNLVDWVSLYTNNAPYTYTNTGLSAVPLRFYRAVSP